VCNASKGKVCTTSSNDGSGTAVKNAEDYWIVDSGATHHVTGNNEGLYELEEVSSMIELADATIFDANLVGKLEYKTGFIMQKMFYYRIYCAKFDVLDHYGNGRFIGQCFKRVCRSNDNALQRKDKKIKRKWFTEVNQRN